MGRVRMVLIADELTNLDASKAAKIGQESR